MTKESLFNKDIIENAFKDLPNYVFCKDEQFVYRLCNDQFIKYAGLKSREEIIGKTDFEMPWGKTTADLYKQEDIEVIQTGNPILEKEVQMEIPHLGKRVLLVSKKALRDKHNKIVGILGIYIDITERKKQEERLKESLEQAKQANESKSEFIANMSHDLRTPITGMLGMVQDMLNTADQTKSSRQNNCSTLLTSLIDTIQRDGNFLMSATNELLQLCNEILEVVRLESGKQAVLAESFNLPKLIKHNIELLLPMAKHKKLELSYEISQDTPTYLNGARIYLDRILLNLISNALKFTKKGFVKILIKKQENTDPITLKFSIKDSGIGIPKDKFNEIFEHFSRLTPAYEGLYQGAGLGLYTVKRYVEAMKGSISVDSEIDKGTCFTLTLPFTVTDHEDQKETQIYPVNLTQSTLDIDTFGDLNMTDSSETLGSILVVEDHTLAAMAIQAALKPYHCSVEVARCGKQAVTMVEQGDYDLILMDIGLPDFNGFKTAKKIRALTDSKKANIPIIALTGHASNPKRRKEASDVGIQDVLSKPAQPLALEDILRRYIFDQSKKETLTKKTTSANSEMKKKRNLKVIDWGACVRMCNADPEFARELLSMLADDLSEAKNTIASHYKNKNMKALRDEIHRVRGGVCYLKVPQLEKLLGVFDETIKEDSPNYTQLKKAHAALQEAIDTFLKAWDLEDY